MKKGFLMRMRISAVQGVLGFLLVFVTLASCAGSKVQSSAGACPRVELGETVEDCPWADIARELGQELDASRPVAEMMEARLATMMGQVRKDAASSELFALWGTSINYDELAKGEIIRPEIIDYLLAQANAKRREGRWVHAGIEHTYGYLLSVLKTPYGYKRARWVRDDIEKGFGFPRGSLGPTPATGTLLRNLTVFAGTFAFDGNERSVKALASLRSGTPKEIANLSVDGLRRRRLEETVLLGEGRSVRLRTDFVFFPQGPAKPDANAALLVYSVLEQGRAQLITAFPVTESFVQGAFKPENLGAEKPVVSRYNAYVPGLTGAASPILGHREEATIKPVTQPRCKKRRC